MGVRISRDQVVHRIRDAGWRFSRRGKKAELWTKPGTTKVLIVPFLRSYPEILVRLVLAQAGCSEADIDRFLREAVK